MDPQSAAHLIRLLRAIAVEFRVSNAIALLQTPYPVAGLKDSEAIDALRKSYAAELS